MSQAGRLSSFCHIHLLVRQMGDRIRGADAPWETPELAEQTLAHPQKALVLMQDGGSSQAGACRRWVFGAIWVNLLPVCGSVAL